MIEVSDHHPARTVRNEPHGEDRTGTPEYGRGLHLVGALAERWGITYRAALKTVWARLPVDGLESCPVPGAEPALQRGLRAAEILAPTPRRTAREDPDWISRGALSFLAEASDLLAGQLDEDMVAALAAQLLVPRLADWCAIWLDGEGGHPRWGTGRPSGAAPRLARVWHSDESRIEELREILSKEPRGCPTPHATALCRSPGRARASRARARGRCWPSVSSPAGAVSARCSSPGRVWHVCPTK